MTEQYAKDYTENWELEIDEGAVQIWSCHDSLDWATVYVLKVNGKIINVIEDYTVRKGSELVQLVSKVVKEVVKGNG